MTEKPSKESLKKILEDLVSLSESIAALKDAVTIPQKEVDGGTSMPKAEEPKDKAKASEMDEASKAKKAAADDAEAKAKAEADEAEAAKKKAEADEAEAKAAKAKADEDAEAAKIKAEADEAEAAMKSKKEAEDKEAAEAAKNRTGYNSMTEEETSKAGLNETEKTLAMKYSYPDMTKMVASLSLELASLKSEVEKEKSEKVATDRFAQISELGFALSGEKAEAQKKRYSEMSESAFASYKEELTAIKSTIALEHPTLKEIIKAGKAQAGKLSVDVDIDKKKESLFDQFKKI